MAIVIKNITGVLADGYTITSPQIQPIDWTIADNGQIIIHCETSDGYNLNLGGGFLVLTIRAANATSSAQAPVVSRQATLTSPGTGDGYFPIGTADTVLFSQYNTYSYDVKFTDAQGNITELVPVSAWIANPTNFQVGQQVTPGPGQTPIGGITIVEEAGVPSLPFNSILDFTSAFSVSNDGTKWIIDVPGSHLPDPTGHAGDFLLTNGTGPTDLFWGTRNVNTTAGQLSGGGALTANLTLGLAPTGTPGSYSYVTFDAYGRETTGSLVSINTSSRLTGGGALSSNLLLDLATSGVSAGTYQGITVDAYGRATNASVISVNTTSGQLTGGGSLNSSLTLGLAAAGTAGTYTTATGDSFTFDAYGRETAVSTATRHVTAGQGLSGGGALSADVTLSIPTQGSITPGTYNSANVTVNAWGIVTAIGQGGAAAFYQAMRDHNGVNLFQRNTLAWTAAFNIADDNTDGYTKVDIANAGITNAMLVNSSLTVTAGTGLSGGGSVSLGGSVTLSLPNTGTSGTINIGNGSITFDAQGRETAWTGPTNLITGSGTNTYVPFFTGAQTLGTDSIFTYTSSTHTLTAENIFSIYVDSPPVPATSLALGNVNATAVNIGRSGINTSISGTFVVDGYTIDPTSASTNQALVYNGTKYLAQNIANSVSNSDGTLTISPTTGAVVASLALGHANTWTAKQTFSAHIAVDGYTIDNSGGASSGQALIYNGTSFVPTSVVNSVFYQTVDSNGTPLTQRPTLNFGAGLTAVDNSGSNRTDVSLPNVGPGAGTSTFATGDSVTLDAQGRVTAVGTVTRQILTDATLTGGGNLTADRTLGINLAHSNTWTAAQTIQVNGVGTAILTGLSIQNNTAGANNAPQSSPGFELVGDGYNATTGLSVQDKYLWQLNATAGTTGSTGRKGDAVLHLFNAYNAVYNSTPILRIDGYGNLNAPAPDGTAGGGSGPPYNVSGTLGVNPPGTMPSFAISATGGGIKAIAVAAPSTPALTVNGSTGSTSYSYYIVAKDQFGNKTLASAVQSVSNGNAVLSSSNSILITWTAVPGSYSYDVIRSASAGTPSSTGSIALSVQNINFTDTGIAASAYTTPARNATADIRADGEIIAGTHLGVDGYIIDVSGGATTNQALIYNGTSIVPTTIGNAQLQNSSITVSGGTAISVSGSPVSLGGTVTVTNTGVTSNVAGTGIGVSAATGAVTISNTGVTSLVAGTAISVSGATGAVTVNNTGVTSAVAGTGISVSGATGAVTFSTSSVVPLRQANASDSQLTTTSATDVISFTPGSQGNFIVYVSWRVITATTNLGINVTWTDGTGAQTQTVLSAATPQATGTYPAVPVYINAKSTGAVKVTATAGTANQVFVSATSVGF